MKITLANVINTKRSSPPKILIHGTEKVGKSTFFAGGWVNTINGRIQLASSPHPIFIQTEQGLNGLSVSAFPLAKSFDEVLEALAALRNEQHDYQTLVIDSADWLEKLIHQHIIESCPANGHSIKTMETAHGGYGKAYAIAAMYWRRITEELDWLNAEKNMGIGIICHSNVVKFNDPSSEPYDRYEIKLYQGKNGGGARDLLCEWADIIGFAQQQVTVNRKKTADGKEVARGTLIRNSLNHLHLVSSAAFVAGNRYNLPEMINLSWDDFSEAFVNSQQY